MIFINKMDKVKFGFFNPATETFLVVENAEEFRVLVERLTEQKREREEVEFRHRLMHEKFDDFDYVVEEVRERQSYCFNEELMEYEF